MDVISKLQKLIERGAYHLRPADGKLVPHRTVMAHNAPWAYVQSTPDARCDIYHKVFFKELRHIHSYCRNCWKIVVRPRTLTELFELYEIEKEMGVPCKCGIELRKTVEGLYGGYFYTRSKEQGVERYKEVREIVSERISPEVPVILKRYCTEFELGGEGGLVGLGPSDKVPDATHEELEMEKYLESFLPETSFNSVQPKHVLANVMKRWIHHAFEHGDLTYLDYTDGKRLTKDYVTYHNKEKDDGFNS
jgi:hypothetical protein